MAPYAMAHLKLGMQLSWSANLTEEARQDWHYDFESSERLNIYLTNTLEEGLKQSELTLGQFISQEANIAAEIKRDKPIMVVLGNPPYSGHSANRSRTDSGEKTWIGTLLDSYYKVDGQSLGERNPKWLQDDYVKFIRFGQWRIARSGSGILAFITNHGYLDNPDLSRHAPATHGNLYRHLPSRLAWQCKERATGPRGRTRSECL